MQSRRWLFFSRSSTLPLIGLLIAITPVRLEAGTPISVEHAIEVLESLEKPIKTAQWEVQLTHVDLANAEDPNSIIRLKPDHETDKVAFDPNSKRFRIERLYVSEWIAGAAPYISGREVQTFDGLEYREWHCTEHGRRFLTPLMDRNPARSAATTAD